MTLPLISLFIRLEQDVVAARQRARQIAARLGFEIQDQTRIATAVSEIARNAFMYAGGGKVEIAVEGRRAPQLLIVRVSDRGPGIRDLDSVLAGRYRSATGMGLGMLGARRMVDHFEVASRPGAGTTVTLGKLFSRRAPEIGSGARPPRARSRRSGSRTRSCCVPSRSCVSARRTSRGSTRSCRTPTAASSPSTRSWTRRRTPSAGPTR
jgi:anti-sigma regulatory factor (Ser/Thr protein kinase)